MCVPPAVLVGQAVQGDGPLSTGTLEEALEGVVPLEVVVQLFAPVCWLEVGVLTLHTHTHTHTHTQFHLYIYEGVQVYNVHRYSQGNKALHDQMHFIRICIMHVECVSGTVCVVYSV